MRWIGMAVLLFFAFAAFATEMWRWVDDRGVVHYSDRPHPGAERVDIQAPQTFTAPQIEAPAPEPRSEPSPEPASTYSRLSILSPEEGETLWNIGAQLNVQLEIEPRLADQHELRVYLDGQRIEDVPQASQFTLDEVFRGERRLRVAIVDGDGRELASSSTITFYVQQASLLNPNRPQTPTPGPGGG